MARRRTRSPAQPGSPPTRSASWPARSRTRGWVRAGRSQSAGASGVSGSNATAAQVATVLLNYVAGNIGATVDFASGSTLGTTATYADMRDLAAAMRSGEIDLTIIHNVNPVFTMPAAADFGGALARVPFVASLSSLPDETTAQADLLLPTHTTLESWGDSNPRHGVYGLIQPVTQPVFDTRHAGDLLLEVGRALGDEAAAGLPRRGFYRFLRDEWERMQPAPEPDPETAEPAPPDFETYWTDALRRGGTTFPVEPVTVDVIPELFETGLVGDLAPATSAHPYTLIAYPSLHFFDGRGANRPWLQEIPEPLLKTTWGTGVEMTPDTARALGAEEGQLVAIASDHGRVDASVIINPHLADGVVAIAIGQGHTNCGRYATGRGVNPIALLDAEPEAASGGVRWLGTGVDITPRELARPIPRLQRTFDQEGRELAQSVSLAALAAGDVHPEEQHFSLYEEHSHPVHHWGMAIDLDACNGCNACVAACYAENNIPVMGAEGMRRGRTMSWLRVERFVEPGPGDTGPDTRFLPMLCQHCDHAPCETVCPVYATYHTDEGLNAQVYNRCVGTRYCSNNCPYKVRRFNWFTPEFDAPLQLQLNPGCHRPQRRRDGEVHLLCAADRGRQGDRPGPGPSGAGRRRVTGMRPELSCPGDCLRRHERPGEPGIAAVGRRARVSRAERVEHATGGDVPEEGHPGWLGRLCGPRRESCTRLGPRVPAKARTCAPRGRGVGPGGPRAAPAWGSGRSPV